MGSGQKKSKDWYFFFEAPHKIQYFISYLDAEWNKQEITLCLHSTNKNLIDYRYFATGSIK
jgi:hypothetical protein